MPLFIFVSGMFSQIKEREKYKMGIIRILETLVIFQLLHSIPSFLLSHDSIATLIKNMCIKPCFSLWYLLSLIYWRLIVYFLPKEFTKKYSIEIIIASFLISILGGFIPIGRIFSIQRTITFMPFFFMGYYAKNIDLKAYITKVPSLCALITLCTVYCMYFFVLNQNVNYILTGATPYWSVTKLTPMYSCIARCLLLLVATLMGIMVMRLTPTRASLSNWGSKTLFIYIYHSFAIGALKRAVTNDYFPKNEWALIAFSFILLIGLMFLSNLKIFNILLNPISYCYKNKH